MNIGKTTRWELLDKQRRNKILSTMIATKAGNKYLNLEMLKVMFHTELETKPKTIEISIKEVQGISYFFGVTESTVKNYLKEIFDGVDVTFERAERSETKKHKAIKILKKSGLDKPEVAKALNISLRTVQKYWN